MESVLEVLNQVIHTTNNLCTHRLTPIGQLGIPVVLTPIAAREIDV